MSHFSRVKTVIRDREILCDALRQLHYNFQEGERLPIRGYASNTEYGQVVLNTGTRYDIGFQLQSDETYSCCADWWGVSGNTSLKEESFLQDLNRTYGHVAVRRQVDEKVEEGVWILEDERVLENGEIELVVSEKF